LKCAHEAPIVREYLNDGKKLHEAKLLKFLGHVDREHRDGEAILLVPA